MRRSAPRGKIWQGVLLRAAQGTPQIASAAARACKEKLQGKQKMRCPRPRRLALQLRLGPQEAGRAARRTHWGVLVEDEGRLGEAQMREVRAPDSFGPSAHLSGGRTLLANRRASQMEKEVADASRSCSDAPLSTLISFSAAAPDFAVETQPADQADPLYDGEQSISAVSSNRCTCRAQDLVLTSNPTPRSSPPINSWLSRLFTPNPARLTHTVG